MDKINETKLGEATLKVLMGLILYIGAIIVISFETSWVVGVAMLVWVFGRKLVDRHIQILKEYLDANK